MVGLVKRAPASEVAAGQLRPNLVGVGRECEAVQLEQQGRRDEDLADGPVRLVQGPLHEGVVSDAPRVAPLGGPADVHVVLGRPPPLAALPLNAGRSHDGGRRVPKTAGDMCTRCAYAWRVPELGA